MNALIAIDRAVDANLNRVSEGLRVVEDIFRYAIVDGALQARLKSLRHQLAAAVPGTGHVISRKPMEDVGFGATGDLEASRGDLTDLLRSNFKRAEEGLRSLEEFFKLSDIQITEKMKAFRYEAYEAERLAVVRMGPEPLERGLYLVLTDPRDGYEELTRWAVTAELPVVQLRCKGGDARHILAIALSMRRITAGTRTRFIVNDRPDIALMAAADGVHVGQKDLPPRDVRRLLGPDRLVGLSTHSLEEVRAANDEPVDYIGFGPLFATASKTDPDPVLGPEALSKAVKESRHPVVAIGGLTAGRIARLDLGGCGNVAVIGAVAEAKNPLAAMTAINRSVKEAL